MTTLVSFITPTWNRHDKLPQLVRVFRAQAHEPKELLVYDDSPSPSAFMRSLGDPAIRYFHSPHRQTIGAKRNFLTQQARGEVIVAADDDDEYSAAWASRCVEWLADHDFVKLSVWRMRRESDGSEWRWDTAKCGADCYVLSGDGATLGPAPTDADAAACDAALWGYGFSYAYRRSVGLAEPFADMSLGEDYEFACRVRRRFRCKLVADGEHLISHTLHPRSSSLVFPQTRLGGSLQGMTPLPEGSPIKVEPGRRYEGVALLRSSHTLQDLKAKIAARGIVLDVLEETPAPAGLPTPPAGYRYVSFAGTASAPGELPWELPRPWRYVDKTRFVQVGAAGAEGEVAIVRAFVGAGSALATPPGANIELAAQQALASLQTFARTLTERDRQIMGITAHLTHAEEAIAGGDFARAMSHIQAAGPAMRSLGAGAPRGETTMISSYAAAIFGGRALVGAGAAADDLNPSRYDPARFAGREPPHKCTAKSAHEIAQQLPGAPWRFVGGIAGHDGMIEREATITTSMGKKTVPYWTNPQGNRLVLQCPFTGSMWVWSR